jgi:formate-dependent nitrite reductase membrane component NrfD
MASTCSRNTCLASRLLLLKVLFLVVLNLDEVKVQCLPFPARNAKVDEMIDFVAGEVKIVSGTVWQLNNNFTILAIKGVLDMLNGEGCQVLDLLRGLAASSNASILIDVPHDVCKLAGWIV